ncbi:MFS transporter [Rhodoferax sp.]|jgi:predicted MFS family arabinose efflux permease|uniref:MFS transporter n=1 Tax=Rhodoferax sp. TaxID=50421 RepID=UPI003782E9A2
MRLSHPTTTVLKLGSAQTLAWASSYYLPAILGAAMARDLGLGVATVFAAFSVALVVSAILGPRAGRAIDAWGGRPVLAVSNLVFALGLAMLALAQGSAMLFLGWAVVGVAMAGGLYEAAFASLVRIYRSDARSAITGITLIAGFASTVGWPISTALESWIGWRGTCWAWAGLHLLIGLPLNLWLPQRDLGRTTLEVQAPQAPPVSGPATQPDMSATSPVPRNTVYLLALVFAITWFISTAMAAHLPALLVHSGAGMATVVLAGALMGPAQVAGRLLEFGLLRHVHPLQSARLAAALHPVGAVALALLGAPAAIGFALLHGAGNGVLTIAKGTLPLALFGPQAYGERQGLLMVPARLAQALAPWLFGLAFARWGANALWLSVVLGSVSCVALWRIAPLQRR